MQFDDSVRAVGDRMVVGDHHDGKSTLMLGSEQVENLFPGLFIEIASGFIGKEHRRLVDERSCNGDPLAFASGEFPGTMVQAMSQAERFKAFHSIPGDMPGVLSRDDPWKRGIFKDGQFREQVVELEDESNITVPIRVAPAV